MENAARGFAKCFPVTGVVLVNGVFSGREKEKKKKIISHDLNSAA